MNELIFECPADPLVMRFDGFHGWENGFGWMASRLEITPESGRGGWVNVRVDSLANLLPPSTRLLIENGEMQWELELAEAQAGFSIPFDPLGRGSIVLWSSNGALSPAEAGLSGDTRPLSFSLRNLDAYHRPRFLPLLQEENGN